MFADVELLAAKVRDRAARGEPLDPVALTFLLRRYRETGSTDVSDALGRALADALTRHADAPTIPARAGWLRLFTEAAAVSDDERLADAARSLIGELASGWPAASAVDEASLSIDACLCAAHLVDPHQFIPIAIDALERIVGGSYRPGLGVAHLVDRGGHVRGGFSDQVHAAGALLTAFELTGRLPYSMLAEELMQLSRADAIAHPDFALTCDAARVLCRLAALHDDAEYRGAAVIATAADYRADAARLLERMSAGVADRGIEAAIYGVALGEWRATTHAGHDMP